MSKRGPHIAVAQVDDASTPTSALDGEMPELIALEISRETLLSGDTRAVLARLRQLTSDRSTVMTGCGRLFVMVSGYDDDERPLPAVAEYGTFMQSLMRDWPFFGWFCALDSDLPHEALMSLPPSMLPGSTFTTLLLAGACDTRPACPTDGLKPPQDSMEPLVIKPRVLESHISAMADGLVALCELHNVPVHLIEARASAVMQTLEDRGLR